MIERVTFLLARIAEDEALAREAAAQGRVGQTWYAETITRTSRPGERAAAVVVAENGGDLWDCEGSPDRAMALAHAAHIARWDPARVLEDCEAKRRVIAEIADHGRLSYDYKRLMLETLAQPYAEHPDFREDWHLLDHTG
jgi:hypothetical protein